MSNKNRTNPLVEDNKENLLISNNSNKLNKKEDALDLNNENYLPIPLGILFYITKLINI